MGNKKDNIIDILNKVSDPDFVKNVWMDGKYWDRISDLEEAIETLEDYNFFEDIKINTMNLNEQEKNEIQSFLTKLLDYQTPKEKSILEDKRWVEISMLAKKSEEILENYTW